MSGDRRGDNLEHQLRYFGLTLDDAVDEPIRPRHGVTLIDVEPADGPIRQTVTDGRDHDGWHPDGAIVDTAHTTVRTPSRRWRALVAAAAVLVVAALLATGLALVQSNEGEIGPAGQGPSGSDADDGGAGTVTALDPPGGTEDTSGASGTAILDAGPSTILDAGGSALAEVTMTADGQVRIDFVDDQNWSPRLFVVLAVEQLLRDPAVLPGSDDDRASLLTRGGLVIRTTMDPAAQAAAAAASDREIGPASGRDDVAEVVTMESANGAIRALHVEVDWGDPANPATLTGDGGTTDDGDFFGPDWAYAGGLRLPRLLVGEVFSPVVQAAAFEAGYGPDTAVYGGGPCAFATGDGPDPYYLGGLAADPIPLGLLTTDPEPCALARISSVVGNDHLADVGRRMGADGIPAVTYPSLALGAVDLDGVELAEVYATLVNEGVHIPATFIERVDAANGVTYFDLEPGAARRDRAISVAAARGVLSSLRSSGPEDIGSGTVLDGQPVAVTSGTDPTGSALWAVGASPVHTSVVAIGPAAEATWLSEDPPAAALRMLEEQLSVVRQPGEDGVLPFFDSAPVLGPPLPPAPDEVPVD